MKTVLTEVGPVGLEVPRDRAGQFDPTNRAQARPPYRGVRFPVRQGLTTGEIRAHLAEIYGVEVSRDLISQVINKIVDELEVWRARPLDSGRFLANVSNDLGC